MILADPVIAQATALGLVLLWTAAGVNKLRFPAGFASILQSYGVVPRGLQTALRMFLPSYELILAVGLLVPLLRPLAAAGSVASLLLYAGAMALTLVRGKPPEDCGCGFGQPQAVSWGAVLRNLVLAVLAANLIRANTYRVFHLYDWALVVVVVIAAGALYATANTLIATGQLTRRMLDD